MLALGGTTSVQLVRFSDTCTMNEAMTAAGSRGQVTVLTRVAGMHGVVLVLRNCGRGERCLRLWIPRFNEQGIDGLIYQPRCGKPLKHTSANGQLVSLIVSHCNTEVFQAFLNNMAEEIPTEEGKQIHPVFNNESWYKTANLNWHHIKPVYLPPYPGRLRRPPSGYWGCFGTNP